MKPDIAQWLRHTAAVCSALSILALGGCARSDVPPEPSEGQATIGAAGGTVNGPDGVQLVVPAGALDGDTTIRIARSSSGAPALSGDLQGGQPIYEVTPHGLRFAEPVTLRLPIRQSPTEDSMALVAEPGGEWQGTPAAFAGGYANIERRSLSWYALSPQLYLGCTPENTDPYTCVWPTLQPGGNITVTPPEALRSSGLSPLLVQPATVAYPLAMSAARDCLGAVLKVDRRVVPPGTSPTAFIPYQRVLEQPIGLGPSPTNSRRATATYTYVAQVGPGETGGVGLRFVFSCRRAHNNAQQNVVIETGYRADVPAQPGTPTITQQPQDVTTTAGNRAEFRVAATAPNTLVIHWQRSNDGGATWANTGIVGEVYALAPAQLADNGARLRASVCSQLGAQLNCVTSRVATLTVTAATVAPVFTQQPQSISVVEGQTASFTATATGTPTPTVRWYRELAGGPVQVGPTCSGSGGTTACTYTTPAVTAADNGARFYALADNGQQVRSDTATLTVTPAATPPAIPANEPADVTVTAGQSATFSVSATGTAPLSYQWQRNGADIAGANGASYTLANAQVSDNGARFRVIVSNGAGSATSREATLTVTAPSACAAPQLIESGAGHAAVPEIAMDASGNAIAVWRQNDGTFFGIYANRYAAGSGWGSAQRIDSGPGDANEPRIALDGSGNALVVWWRSGVHANRYAAGSGWGTAQLLAGGLTANPDVVMDASGNAIAVWQRFDGSTDNIDASRYTSGSGWSAPQPIENGAGSASNARIAVDGSGNAIAVWSQSNGTSYNLTANRYTQGVGWGTAQPIETLSREADAPDIAMNASGDAVVVWRDLIRDGNGNLVDAPVYAIRYTPGSGWGTAQRLDSGTNYRDVPYPPQVAIDAQGNAIAVWRDYDGAGFRVFAGRYVAGSGWAAIEQLQSPGGGDVWYPPDVAMDVNGNAIVVWMQWQTTTFGIFGNRYTPGSGWGGATLLANATNDVGWPRVALNGSGTAIAVWHEGDGTTYNVKAVRCP
ncbi:MAG: immunoglobulin domain-containing protein [Pseudomonadota bacterium]